MASRKREKGKCPSGNLRKAARRCGAKLGEKRKTWRGKEISRTRPGQEKKRYTAGGRKKARGKRKEGLADGDHIKRGEKKTRRRKIKKKVTMG